MKVKKTLKMVLLIIIIFIFNVLIVWNSVQAISLNEAYIYSGGDCGSLLTYRGIVVKTYYAAYQYDGVSYPAYCVDKTKQGISNDISYSVSVENAISDVGLWRYIIEGYPYKSIEELGCANKEEAFTATKQAVYCYIHGNEVQDYAAIGEAGKRTLGALKQIVHNAQNSAENQIANTVEVKKLGKGFEPDSTNPGYLSREYQVISKGVLSDYEVTLSAVDDTLLQGILVCDKDNQEKKSFQQNEHFKILIPIEAIAQAGKFKIEIQTEIKTKPVFYGKVNDSYYQDYALTASTYEDSMKSEQDSYPNNETEITIVKQDKETEERLSGVEFMLLNDKKEVVYENLVTNEKGEIVLASILPGTYYLKELKGKEGYIPSSQELEILINWNEKILVTVNNQKEDIPKIEITKEVEEPKRLPITGM